MWTLFTVDRMDFISAQWFMPLCLLIDYTLFVYLVVFYWRRRHEPRVRLLLFVGWLSVAILIPYARSNHEKVTHLNEISESCGVLTFLIQITIVGRDLNKKIKFRSILWMTILAEVLVAVDLVVVVATVVDEFDDRVLPDDSEHLTLDILENGNLLFVFGFRFYCIAATNGWRDILSNRRTELVCYILFATSAVPFLVLGHVSGLAWDAPRALYNRLTIVACLVIVTRSKIRKDSSANASVYQQHDPAVPSFPRTLMSTGSFASKTKSRSVTGRGVSKIYAVRDKQAEKQ